MVVVNADVLLHVDQDVPVVVVLLAKGHVKAVVWDVLETVKAVVWDVLETVKAVVNLVINFEEL